jgi:type III pantothenate kinase
MRSRFERWNLVMILEIDAGNTRIKWRLRNDAVAAPEWLQGSVVADALAATTILKLGNQLSDLSEYCVDRVLVSNVRGDEFKQALSAWVVAKGGVSPEFAVAKPVCSGVTNGYKEPAKLGVDRWLAMLAAYHLAGKACCVVDCGTTITLDLLDDGGVHLGGYIVPGLSMMRAALAAKSTALKLEGDAWGVGLGHSTAEAIHHGLMAMVLGVVERVQYFALAQGLESQWFWTGGDSSLLQSHLLTLNSRVVPSLVLDGLRLGVL